MPERPETVAADRAKARDTRPLRGLMPFIRPYREQVMFALAALVLTACLSLILPVAVRKVVDGFAEDSIDLLQRYFVLALVVAGLLAVGSGLRYALVTWLGERVVADIRKKVFSHMISMSPRFYERLMTGEVLSRLTTDTTLVLSVVSSTVSFALRNLLVFAGGIVMLLVTSLKLALIVLLVVPAVLVPILALGRKLRAQSRDNQDLVAKSSGSASEALLSVQTIQANTHEKESRARFDEMTEASYRSAKRRIGTRAVMTSTMMFLAFSGIVAVLWVGAIDVRSGSMTAGELVQFVIFAVMVASSVAALSEMWGEMLRAAGATERIVELLAAVDSVTDPPTPKSPVTPCHGEIAFENVVFRYPMRLETAALDGVSFSVRPGEMLALVGPSGAGKSTIFQLLLRFFDPQAGRVMIDGIDLKEMKRADFRRHIALVPQDPAIFADTARENIRFGWPEANDNDIENAARAAAAHEFLIDLPDGYDTQVGERGVMLSGGQKQRVAIARAILRDASILLLDEATSALDAESEFAVQQAVETMSRNRSVLVIAHRLATVKRADRILVFDRGWTVAEGTHETLVSENGLYARLARLQFTEGLAA